MKKWIIVTIVGMIFILGLVSLSPALYFIVISALGTFKLVDLLYTLYDMVVEHMKNET